MPMASRRIGRPPAGANGERTSKYPQLCLRVPPPTIARVRALSRLERRSIWRVVADAIDAYGRERRRR